MHPQLKAQGRLAVPVGSLGFCQLLTNVTEASILQREDDEGGRERETASPSLIDMILAFLESSLTATGKWVISGNTSQVRDETLCSLFILGKRV